MGHVIQGALPGHRFDTAHARGHTALGGDLEQTDVAGARDMRTATQFGGVVAHLQHAYVLAVLLAEQRHRAELERFLHAHVVDFGRVVGAHLLVDLAFDDRQVLGADRREVREVETQAIGGDQRALLLHVGAQHFAQGGMQQVGGRVVEDGGAAALAIDLAGQHIADLQAALGELAHVPMELARELLGVADVHLHAGAGQGAVVTDLATGLGVERSLVGQHDDVITGLGTLHRAAVLENGDHGEVVGLQAVIPEEDGRLERGDQIGRQGHATTELAGRARGLALGVHCGVEALDVHGQVTLARDVLGEIEREAVGVVQAERIHAGDHAVADLGRDVVENLHARIQRFSKTLFLGLQGAHDGVDLGRQFGIGHAHLLDQGRHQLAEERLAHAQHPAVAQCAADDTAQHVTAAFVGRQHAIDDQERTGTDVVGDHAQRLVFQVGGAGQLGGLADQGLEQVDLIVGVHVL